MRLGSHAAVSGGAWALLATVETGCSPLDWVFLGAGAWESTRDIIWFWSFCSGIPLGHLVLKSHQKSGCERTGREVSQSLSLPVLRNQVERSLWHKALNPNHGLPPAPTPSTKARRAGVEEKEIRFRSPLINFLFYVTRPHCGRGKHITQAINLWLWCLRPLSSSPGQGCWRVSGDTRARLLLLRMRVPGG